MPAHLLAWNPKRWEWHDLSDLVAAFESGKAPIERWSCGTVKHIEVGSRVFLIRLGKEPKGIFGHGTVVKGSYEDVHFEDSSRTCQYVDYQVDWIVNPEEGRIIPRRRLDMRPFAKMRWDTQMSGIRIPDSVADALLVEWARLVGEKKFALPDETDATLPFPEGAKKVVTINSYERNPRARKACISHYGTGCSICGFVFSKGYGKVGEGLIHVHHLALLSAKGKRYNLDPIKDLRPVCPNCHAIIHQRVPPYTVAQVKKMLRNAEK